jgi:asparagine synthase (glutamine-hydrolysing)
MTSCLLHRGPDDAGVWVDEEAGVALGHRRLSIVDLSPLGHQPMEARGGRYMVAFNGEIYNFPELRRELEGKGHRFRGHSDTEVLLASVEEWGVEASLRRFVGMFAFALWDRAERTLILCRDRLGEKPLFYGWSGGVFLFGSELKALRAHPRWRGEVDRDALALYRSTAGSESCRRARFCAWNRGMRVSSQSRWSTGPCGRRPPLARATRSAAPSRRRPTPSTDSFATPLPTRWWRTSRSAHSFRVASTRQRWWR